MGAMPGDSCAGWVSSGPRFKEFAIGDRLERRAGGHPLEHATELLPFVPLVNFPAVQVQVGNSPKRLHLIQSMDKVFFPISRPTMDREKPPETLQVAFTYGMTSLNHDRMGVSLGADTPEKRAPWPTVQVQETGSRARESGLSHHARDALVELPLGIAESNRPRSRELFEPALTVHHLAANL
jgi:hypothetical protein